MKTSTKKLINKTVAITTLFCMTAQGAFGKFLDLANVPLFIGANVPPQVMLTISKEQQLFKKAYNDYSDLDGDGELETTYKHDIDYYGYFDSFKCYRYDTGQQLFVPVTVGARDNGTDDNGNSTKAAIEANKAAKYCASGSGLWSGNFLNWISMSRMDTVRRLLYGGMRALDTPSGTVLERAHFPADAHAWAKYYPGKITRDPATGDVTGVENDIDRLTPFSGIPIATNPTAKTATAFGDFCILFSIANGLIPFSCGVLAPVSFFPSLPQPPVLVPNPPAGGVVDVDIGFTSTAQFDPAMGLSIGDQVLFEDAANPARFFQGVVMAFPTAFSQAVVRVHVNSAGVAPGAGGTPIGNLRVTNLSRTGITFCNVTIPRSGNFLSATNQDPPLIRAALGNFSLWSANERYQCYWRNEALPGIPLGVATTQKVDQALSPNISAVPLVPPLFASNSNQSVLSGIPASAENPAQFERGLGTGIAQGDYVVRVQACVSGLFGTERCKQYPSGNYKPIGLLQEYGDNNLIQFGLMTGSYRKNISGGVLRKNVGSFNDEVNLDTDGSFKTPAVPPGSPRSVTSAATPQGIVNTLNYIRLWGYDYNIGVYRVLDNCAFKLTDIVENTCTSWGNPMSEIYFESLRYFAGNKPTPDYTYAGDPAGSKDNQLGLPLPDWKDPVSKTNYCAPLNVLVFNASVSTSDDDLRGTSASAIGGSATAAELTNTVGSLEGITGKNFFVGKLLGASATATSDPNFELCTAKTIPGLGDVSGICPEGPTVAGSYLMAGLAYQAHTSRIRSDIEIPPLTIDNRSLKVTTYGIQLATNVPTLNIPVPGKPGQNVIIQPIYRLNKVGGAKGGGTLVDLKFIEQKMKRDAGGNLVSASGKIYLNWEDSEQGADFDQDMVGTLAWEIDASTIKVTTATFARSTTVDGQGFGYAISGTKAQDGPHFHSGIEGFSYPDPTPITVTGGGSRINLSGGCNGCQVGDPATTATYTLGASSGSTLQDPMWYAAKYGAFVEADKDQNGFVNPNKNNKPDVVAEWDSKLTNGRQGSDGIPDTYFLVTNPLGLVAALDRAFIAILSNASASSVATNSTQLQTGTTIYQARFNGNDWSGQVLAFGVDAGGSIASVPIWDAGQVVNSQDPLDNGTPPGQGGSGRAIITVNDSRVGVPFRWPADPANPTSAEIGKTLVDALNTGSSGNPPAIDNRGNERLNYLRGSQASEGASTTAFRVRPTSRLGDIVDSNPNFIAAPNEGFGDTKFSDFRKDNLLRTPMIYVGSNDGMLHGFRAADGRELLAFVPSMVQGSLNQLTDKLYVGNQHRYFVDGSPEIGSALITAHGAPAPEWRTVLVSALGGGAQGLFALDVTKPDAFAEAKASDIVLWEFTHKDDPDLGFIYAQPTIRRMANGRFAAVVPGGYNNSKPEKGVTPAKDEVACTDSAARLPAGCTTSSTGSAYLFIIFLDGPGADGVWDEGTDYIKIRAASAGDDPATPNGFTQPLVADVDADGFADFIYAGDLRGNLWKFDVRLPPAPLPAPAPVPNPSGDTSVWVSGSNRVILFVARDPDTFARQPITAKPEATLHPTSGFIITFGTGKYIERTDPFPSAGAPPAPPSNYQTQSFYGIWDKNDARPIATAGADPNLAPAPAQTVADSRDQLLPHQIAVGTTASAGVFRVIVPVSGKPDTPDWSTDTSPPAADDSLPKHMGWLLDFPSSLTTGERSTTRPIINSGRLIFSTLLPLTDACQFGGTSFTMVIDPTTGGRIDGPVLDTDANGLLNSKDVVSFGGNLMYASGVQSTIGITPTPTIIRASSLPQGLQQSGSQILGTSGPLVASQGVLLAYALAAGSSGGNASTVIGLSAAGGRVSWRELMQE